MTKRATKDSSTGRPIPAAQPSYAALRPRSLFLMFVFTLSLAGMAYMLPLLQLLSKALMLKFSAGLGNFQPEAIAVATAFVITFAIAELLFQAGLFVLRQDGRHKIRNSGNKVNQIKPPSLPVWLKRLSAWWVVIPLVLVSAGIVAALPVATATLSLFTWVAGGLGLFVAATHAYLNHCQENVDQPYFDQSLWGGMAGSTATHVLFSVFCSRINNPAARSISQPEDGGAGYALTEAEEEKSEPGL